jgi:hypothetical protein
MLDLPRFPTTRAYLTGLPQGLESHPTCEARVEVFEPFFAPFPALRRLPGVPGPVSALLCGDHASHAWVPEVVAQAALLIVRDSCLRSDAEFMKLSLEVNRASFDKPLVRSLMRLVSPTLMVMGASKRWGTFHRGSTLQAAPTMKSGGRTLVGARLAFPDGLFPPLFLSAVMEAFRAALSGARGKNVELDLAEATRTFAAYRVSWDG